LDLRCDDEKNYSLPPFLSVIQYELVLWCRQNNLELNLLKTVEMLVDSAPPLSPGHDHLSGSEVGTEHQLHPQKGPAANALSSALEETWSAPGLRCSPSCAPPSLFGSEQQRRRTERDCSVLYGLQSTSSEPLCPLSRIGTAPELGGGQGTSWKTPHTLHTDSLSCFRLAGASESSRPGLTGTGAASSPQQTP